MQPNTPKKPPRKPRLKRGYKRGKYRRHTPTMKDGRVKASRSFREINGIPEGFLTIGEVAERSGLSQSELRRLIMTNRIVPTGRSELRGWWLFHEDVLDVIKKAVVPRALRPVVREDGTIEEPVIELQILPAPEPSPIAPPLASARPWHAHMYGEDAAVRVFQMLQAGKRADQIVIETNLHPSIISTIATDYARLAGALIVGIDVLERFAKLPLEGPTPIRTVEDLLEFMEAAVKVQLCDKCRQRHRAVCNVCYRTRTRNAVENALQRAKDAPEIGADPDDGDIDAPIEPDVPFAAPKKRGRPAKIPTADEPSPVPNGG